MEAQKIWAVLIDTVSIQEYIFASNKLKENLGASFLVQDIYRSIFRKALEETFADLLDQWKEHPEGFLLKKQQPFEVGYIGGGNALLLFREEDRAKRFIREWTRRLLVEAPGITTAVMCNSIDWKSLEENFQETKRALDNQLRANRFTYSPQTILPRHGITAECSRSGFSMEIWNDVGPAEEKGYVSSVTSAKIQAAGKSQKELEDKYHHEILKDTYTFTDQISELGQRPGEDSHIAIVHIDGNDMAKRFHKMTTLESLRNLSKTVQEATENAFKTLLKHITDRFNDIKDEVHIVKRDGNYILPIRPIILGGDDITFVCDGRLGVYFAKIFMNAFQGQEIDEGEPLSACAGIAIVKTKFPFFRGYLLAEQLCRRAKEKRREQQDKGSWLDFHIAYGGFSGTLNEIRKNHYTIIWQGKPATLLFRPYCLDGNGKYSLSTLIKNTRQLKKEFPNVKHQELQRVLYQGEGSVKTFVEEQRYRDRKLPKIMDNTYETDIFGELPKRDSREDKTPWFETPYFDMIEFMECYPDFELQ